MTTELQCVLNCGSDDCNGECDIWNEIKSALIVLKKHINLIDFDTLLEILDADERLINFEKSICTRDLSKMLQDSRKDSAFDIDFVDINYDASVGRVFRLFDRFDMLDRFVTPIADGFENRAIKIDGFIHLEYYVLSKEDIIISKLGRYSEKDIEDITLIVKNTNKALLNELIENLISKDDFSERVKEEFMKNSKKFKERFNV